MQAETQAATISTEQPVTVQSVKRVKLNTTGVGKVCALLQAQAAKWGIGL